MEKRTGKQGRERSHPGMRLETKSAGLVPSVWFHMVPLGRPHRFGGYSWGTDAPREMSHPPGPRAWVSVSAGTTAPSLWVPASPIHPSTHPLHLIESQPMSCLWSTVRLSPSSSIAKKLTQTLRFYCFPLHSVLCTNEKDHLSDPKWGCPSRGDRTGPDGKALGKACLLCN